MIAGRWHNQHMGGNEAFSRVKIDAQLKDAGWKLTDGRSVRFEHGLGDGTKADYVLCDRRGQALAVLEAKKASMSLGAAEPQALAYAAGLGVPFVFLANGEEVRFRDLDRDAHFRPVATVFAQEDLERRIATRTLRVPPTGIAVDGRVAGRDYQRDCIEVLCREMELGRRKLLVEMATGTGKTRMAAALIKRLFDANWVTRALFLVDRNTLAKQTEDAFADHLPTLSTYRVPRTGERFLAHKQITICTLQTMINEYRHYSAGYFDLVVIDECHRSIYGEFRKVLDHFDAVRIGLTATPLVGTPPDDWDEEDKAQVRDTLKFFELQAPTFRYTLKEAIEAGYLVPYRIYRAQTVKTAATGGFEVKRDEIDWEALDGDTRAELEELFDGGDTITRRSGGPGAAVHRARAQSRDGARVPRGAGEGLYRLGRRAPGTGLGQDDRVRGDQAARRDAGADAGRGVRRQEAAPDHALRRLRRLGHGRAGHAGRADRDPPLPQGGVPADPGLGEHAGYGLRLPGGRQPGDGALHQVRRALPADARARHAQGRPHQEGPVHDLRLRRQLRLPRRRGPAAGRADHRQAGRAEARQAASPADPRPA